jgi:hypothetical protein
MQVSSPWVPERPAASRWQLRIVDDVCGPFWLERRPPADGDFYLSGDEFHEWRLHGDNFSAAEREAFIRIVTWIARTWPDVDPVDLIQLTRTSLTDDPSPGDDGASRRGDSNP